jgi:hypothetical protein
MTRKRAFTSLFTPIVPKNFFKNTLWLFDSGGNRVSPFETILLFQPPLGGGGMGGVML